jgi:hypothetical protein
VVGRNIFRLHFHPRCDFSISAPKHSSITIGHPCSDDLFKYAFGNPEVARHFINAMLDFKGDDTIESVTFLDKDLPSEHSPGGPKGYNFTVDLRCGTRDGRHFLIEMQNDYRSDYHLKALVEHSRMISHIDKGMSGEEFTDSETVKGRSLKSFWKDIQGIYTIVLTNKTFSLKRMKERYRDEVLMEPYLVNPYELRHTEFPDRHYGDVRNQIILVMLGNLKAKTPKETHESKEKWSFLFSEKSLSSGVAPLPTIKVIEDYEYLAKDEPGIEEFFKRMEINHIPTEFRERVERRIRDYNESMADITNTVRKSGFEEGKIEGKAEGRAEGKAEGRAEVAMGMITEALDSSLVSKFTGLTLEEVKALKVKVLSGGSERA